MDVHVERAGPLLVGQLLERPDRLLGGGVVDDDVEPAELVGGALDGATAVVAVGEVAGQAHAATAPGLDELLRVGRVVALGEIGQRDVGALLGEGDGHGAPDAGVAAGDQRLPAGQQVAPDVAGHLVVRLGVHRPGAAGVGLFLGRGLLAAHARRS